MYYISSLNMLQLLEKGKHGFNNILQWIATLLTDKVSFKMWLLLLFSIAILSMENLFSMLWLAENMNYKIYYTSIKL